MAWLAIALASGTIAGYQFFAEGWSSAVWMLFVTVVSVIMFNVRRKQRIRMEEERSGDNSKNYH